MDDKLKKITFSKSLRGYACEEVDTYLRYVADRYEQRSRECTELRRQMALIAAKMNEYTEGLNKTAEAESAQKKSVQETCDSMIDEAKRQAAHILADAEAEAEVIRRRAEDNAQTIAANAAREGARVVNDAARSVAARNNAADRLVEEIDSFREEVYALYTRHITELDQLAERTNAFYDRKTAVAENAMAENAMEEPPADAEADADCNRTEDAPVEEETVEPVDEPMDEPVAQPIRIDWKNRRATRDLVIDIADEEDDTSGQEHIVPQLEDGVDTDEDDLEALFLSLTGKNMLSAAVKPDSQPEQTAQSAEKAAYDFAADEYEDPDGEADEYEDPDGEADEYEDPDGEADEYEDPDGEADEYEDPDGEADEYEDPDGEADEYEDPDGEADEYEDPDGEADEYEDPDGEADEYEDPDGEADAEDDTDWLLDNLKAQYAVKPNSPRSDAKTAPADGTAAPDRSKTAGTRANAAPENFDELLASDTATSPVQDVSLTGEFERIYNKEQAEKYMEEVEKQPLNVPEKPKNPRKHTRF